MKIFKKWWFWVIVIVVIGAIGSASNSKNSQPSQTIQTQQTQETKQAEQPTKTQESEENVNKPTITKDEFDKIQNGMTYEEVTKIIGGPGELVSETGEKGADFYTVVYQYKGEGSLGANANLIFQGGKLQSKAQFGLK
ncbi:DUF3862 domain-containing protein [Petroclostridium xylanilyticum]|jgi:hypothetical protein|uniref:DUF3862 domain-containing protein n=1 Tax=Petroclostridium xylanilyticum TaxID=1792311 RepID=UPI000B9892DE|nr:DUF3862 domain-containing protein [Petroclostridium xylanilyticum]